VSFRLVQADGPVAYAPSATYTLRLRSGVPVPTPSPAPTPDLPPDLVRSVPRARGDQLVLYYDARDGFTTFVNVANRGEATLDVVLRFHGPDLVAVHEVDVALAPGATRTLDVGALRDDGLPASAGIVLATARDARGAAVTSRSLAGSFTVANLSTSSAWGAPAPARLARLRAGGALPPTGSAIDGSTIVLEQIAPRALDLAVYYDPDSLEPVDDGGHQLLFVSFADAADGTGGAGAASVAWDVTVVRNDGTVAPRRRHATSGVEQSDLVSIGGAQVAGASGGMRFGVADGAGNRLVFFAESLGTFATGYLLPAIDED
jgi:hypothetical protein